MFVYFCAVAIITLIGYMVYLSFQNRCMHHTISIDDFPKGFGEVTIVFISDIHRRAISEKLLKKLPEKVDFVIIGGDLMEKGVSFERVRSNVQKLTKLGQTYFVWGNNDYEESPQKLDVLLQEENVNILSNTARLFESYEGEKLSLIGIDDIGVGKANYRLAMEDCAQFGESNFKILVSHNPAVLDEVREEDKIGLLLSGHTHGGQIRLFGFGLYPKGRLYKEKNMIVLISNGYGTTGIPMRLGAKSEVHSICLKGH